MRRWKLYLCFSLICIQLFIGIPLTLSAFHIPYQLYLIDVLLILVVFCSLTFMIGYFGKEQVIRSRGIIDDPEPFMIRISSTLTSSNPIKQTTSIGYKLKTQRERVSISLSPLLLFLFPFYFYFVYFIVYFDQMVGSNRHILPRH